VVVSLCLRNLACVVLSMEKARLCIILVQCVGDELNSLAEGHVYCAYFYCDQLLSHSFI